MPKKKTLKYWKTKIDKVFHEYIRRRDVNDDGYGSCISCKKPIHFHESDAGHFISRKQMSTRYDERNVNLQCRKCNRFEYGRQFEYAQNIGIELAEELLKKSRQTHKLLDPEWQEVFDYFKVELDKLKKSQNF